MYPLLISYLGKNFRACSAIFTFVSLNKEDLRPQPVPELKVQTDAEKVRFEAGRQRYIVKKQRRKRKNENQDISMDKPMSVS